MKLSHILVHAGHHPRNACPIRLPFSHPAPVSFLWNNETIPVQQDGDHIVFILPSLPAGEQATLLPSDAPPASQVSLSDDGKKVAVRFGEEEFTNYHYADVPARPYFYPVKSVGGVMVTRSYPMVPDYPSETRDHPHHKSLYFAYGLVNEVDNWSEEKGHGHTKHRLMDELVSGSVFGRMATTSDWTDSNGLVVLTQKAAVTFWQQTSEHRIMDIDLQLIATQRDVQFGDTKEGGLVTVRVASSMDVPRGGKIENAYGGINEGETWGKSAHWCDYSGIVEGQQVGIAVMDHPLSFRYPTYWHVRDYGLMGANPFALNDYTRGLKNGSHLLKSGESLRFVYRIMIHNGDAVQADIRNHYLNFVSPPKVEVIAE